MSCASPLTLPCYTTTDWSRQKAHAYCCLNLCNLCTCLMTHTTNDDIPQSVKYILWVYVTYLVFLICYKCAVKMLHWSGQCWAHNPASSSTRRGQGQGQGCGIGKCVKAHSFKFYLNLITFHLFKQDWQFYWRSPKAR